MMKTAMKALVGAALLVPAAFANAGVRLDIGIPLPGLYAGPAPYYSDYYYPYYPPRYYRGYYGPRYYSGYYHRPYWGGWGYGGWHGCRDWDCDGRRDWREHHDWNGHGSNGGSNWQGHSWSPHGGSNGGSNSGHSNGSNHPWNQRYPR